MALHQLFIKNLASGSRRGLKSYLVTESVGALALKVGNTALVLTSGILLARILGAKGFGIYAYSMALIQLISMPIVMGFPHLIVRNVAAYHAGKDFSRLRGLLTRANQFVLGLAFFFRRYFCRNCLCICRPYW